MKTNFYQQAIKSVKFLQDNNLLPFIPIIETAHRPIVSVGGKKYLLQPYPRLGEVDKLLMDLQNGVSFPELTKKLKITDKFATIEAYTD